MPLNSRIGKRRRISCLEDGFLETLIPSTDDGVRLD